MARNEVPYIGTAEAAEKMGVAQRTVRSWCEKGSLPGAYRPHEGGPWLIPCPPGERPPPPEPGLTTAEAAEYLGISKHSLYHFRRTGRVDATLGKIGKLDAYYYTLDDLDAFKRNHLSAGLSAQKSED